MKTRNFNLYFETGKAIRMRLAVLVLCSIAVFAGCTVGSSSLTLEFPENENLGELLLIEDPNCFTCGSGAEQLGNATGKRDIRLPGAHWYVSLGMPKNASRLMPYLANPSLSKIGDINLRGSDVKDDDLRYLAGIDLQSITLNETKITGEGLKYLKPNKKWMFVNLEDCTELNPEYLSHFKGWKHLTIRLVPHKSSGNSYTVSEKKLLELAKKYICDGQPENICGTQIR